MGAFAGGARHLRHCAPLVQAHPQTELSAATTVSELSCRLPDSEQVQLSLVPESELMCWYLQQVVLH